MLSGMLTVVTFGISGSTTLTVVATVLAASVGPVLAYITYRQSKKHVEGVEETSTISEAIGAVADANVSITKIVTELLAPMRSELDRMSEKLRAAHNESDEQSHRIDAMAEEMAALQVRFTSMVNYVSALRRQLTSAGLTPIWVPQDLYQEGYTFEDDV